MKARRLPNGLIVNPHSVKQINRISNDFLCFFFLTLSLVRLMRGQLVSKSSTVRQFFGGERETLLQGFQ